jgi:organic radical activating enzyme
VDDLAAIAPEVPLFVQPVTPAGGVAAPAREELLAVADLALARGLTVRVVPQLHRVLRLP